MSSRAETSHADSVALVLRVGVAASVAVIFIGLLVTFARNPSYLTSGSQLHSLSHVAGTFPHTPAQIARGISRFQGEAVTALGLFLLVLTPVVRVAASLVHFAAEPSVVFTVISAAVLAIIVGSFILGKASAG